LIVSSSINGVQEGAMNSTCKQQQTTRNGVVAASIDVMPSDQSRSDVIPSAGGGDFIDETVAIWQKRTTRRLTREDGREIVENMTGFFRILLEWDRAERAAEQNKAIPNQATVQRA
jgi:hypothetical protein